MKDAPLRHALEYALAAPWIGLVRALPHAASRTLGGALGALAWAVDGRRRRTALDNLRHAFPERSEAERRRITRSCFRHFGAAAADALSAARFDPEEVCRRSTSVGLEHALAAGRRGRGTILLTAHYGHWEFLSPYVSLAVGPMAMVGRSIDNPHIDRVVRRLRERPGNRLLDKRGAVRRMFREIQSGGRLSLLIDQRVAADEAIDVPFFGRPALTSPIVARLARRTGAPIVLATVDPLPAGRYRVEFFPAIEHDGRADEADDFELTRRCLEAFETVIRKAPERWLWLHRRWRH